jgi:AraC family transcriptional regulator
MVAIYHDQPETTPPDQLRSDAALVVPADVALPAELTEQRLPAGRYARTSHTGPYEQLPQVWARLIGEWLPASGERMAASPSYELYRNDPSRVPKDELLTELYVALE